MGPFNFSIDDGTFPTYYLAIVSFCHYVTFSSIVLMMDISDLLLCHSIVLSLCNIIISSIDDGTLPTLEV